MKKLLYILTLIPILVLGQSQDQNYIKTTIRKGPSLNPTTTLQNPELASTQVTYFDGLGRPIQHVAYQQSTSKKDIVSHIEYDAFGRQIKDYLPYVYDNQNLYLAPNAQISTLNFYGSNDLVLTGNPSFETTNNPFSEKELEGSPLNRVFKQAAPGDAWAMGNGKEIKFDYGSNKTNEVKKFKVVFEANSTENHQLETDGYYTENVLYKSVIKDENWKSFSYNESFSYNYFKLGSSGYMSGNNLVLDINNDILNLTVNFSCYPKTNFKTGAIKSFPINIEDVNLGDLVDVSTGIAVYNLYIENNTLYAQDIYNGTQSFQGVSFNTTLTKSIVVNSPDVLDHTTVEFKNKQGQVVLKRTHNQNKWHDTYYVYDDYGNLTYVLSPEINTYPMEQQIYPNIYIENENIETVYNHPNQEWANYFEADLGNNQLYIYFGSYDNANVPLNTSSIAINLAAIGFNVLLPDMTLGPVTIKLADGTYSDTHYSAYIQNGNIYLTGDGTIAKEVHMDFQVDLNTITGPAPTSVSVDDINKLGYQYKYDSRNRLVEKKLPGKDWEYIIYDKLDRPILTQDANLKTQNKWLFTKYDAFGRVTYTGIWTNPTPNQSRATVQNTVNSQTTPVWFETKLVNPITIAGTSIYYSNTAFPNTFQIDEIEILTIQYYDNYEIGNQVAFNPANGSGTWEGMTAVANVKGLPTVSRVKVLETNNSWITTATYYDAKGRAWETHVKNDYQLSEDWTLMKLDFIGKVLKTQTSHTKNGTTTTAVDTFTYDHADRLLTQVQKINTQPEQLIVKNTYDELGQLIKKGVGNTESTPLQEVDYAYNIRGWLKDINNTGHLGNDLFAFHLNYNEQDTPYTYAGAPGTALYNGNISSTNWTTNNNSTAVKSYYYSYDALNRLKTAYSAENDVTNNKYLENIHGYDRNGNILGLNRQSQNPTNPNNGIGIDYLTYTYDANQLKGVKDNYGLSANGIEGFKDGNTVGDDYEYDANGNMIADKNKGIIEVAYNYMNLPTMIVFEGHTKSLPKVIYYSYDATGQKLKKRVYETVYNPNLTYTINETTTDYIGNYIYENNVLQFFSQPEGYVSHNNGAFSYVFQYKDHLGNVRLSYADANNDGVITSGTTELFYDGFENGSGWDSTGAIYGETITAYDTTKKHSGAISGKLENLTTTVKYVHSNTWIPINITQPTEYIFSGWVYSDNPVAAIYLFEKTDAETGYFTTVAYENMGEKNRWVYIQRKVTVQPNITKLNLRIDNNGGGTVWFDDVSIRQVNPNSEIVEENNYYPFGLKHKDSNNLLNLATGNAVAQKYKYNGQEWQDELGLNVTAMDYRQYDNALGRFNGIDSLSEISEDKSVYHFANNNPVIYADPTGLTGENFATKYIDEKGNELLNTNDGSNAVVTVSDEYLDVFLADIRVSYEDRLNSSDWNSRWKAFLIGFELSESQENILSQLDTDWARKLALKYWQTGDNTDFLKFAYAAALSQWTNPVNIIGAASGLAVRPRVNATGIIYLRRDITGNLKPYIGQVKNEARYLARQAEHARANPNSVFEFEIIDRGNPSGKFPTSLDLKEQQALDKLGGPTNKSNPSGSTSNKKNVIKK
ncbi:DUF6443 domain-containing protein [Flavobacterium sp. HNIBRBA15423]|uniref:DUF6443 domain-containing protein n=1 Tax=Flavobacterium sp. HNIBRBA15423 TaxID=3458683 RepID=UPI00404505B7